MINKIQQIEKFLKSIVGIILALGSILTALGFIYSGIIKLNNTVSELAAAMPLVDEHGIFVYQEVDFMIDEALDLIEKNQVVPRRLVSKLLIYKETLPKTLNYKQRMNIDYIVRKTDYK